jgi:hypothetical protein
MYTPYNISSLNQVEEHRPLVGALFLKGNNITGNIIKELQQSIQQKIIQEHYQHIFGEAYPNIVWEVLQLTKAISRHLFSKWFTTYALHKHTKSSLNY